MVYVQTLKGISFTIEGNKIIEQQDSYIVYNDKEITGIFDIGSIQFMYLTHKRKDNTTWIMVFLIRVANLKLLNKF